MPIFLDSHVGSVLPIDSVRQFLRHARNGTCDASGVAPLELYCGDDGRIYFLMAAPDEAAVLRLYASQGIVSDHLRRLRLFGSGTDPLTAPQKALVRHIIVGEQATAAGLGDSLPESLLRDVG